MTVVLDSSRTYAAWASQKRPSDVVLAASDLGSF